jgi:hypothetical protein
VEGLKSLGEPGACAALESYGVTRSHQERVAVDRAVQALRGGDPKGVAAAEKKIDELTDRVHKLEARLLKLEASP